MYVKEVLTMAAKNKIEDKRKHVMIGDDTHGFLINIKQKLRMDGLKVRSIDDVMQFLISYYIQDKFKQQKSSNNPIRLNPPNERGGCNNNLGYAAEEELNEESYGY